MGIVYKQSYANPSKVPRASIPGLNVRHLQYIATRPGAVYNPACGFGLWGKLDSYAQVGNINSLEEAKAYLRAESERGRTIFRAIVSLGEPDAGERGFYERSAWEKLINENIAKIAKEMHIAPSDLRWMASMHIKERHPHTHLIFWDAGKQPRQDFMPPERFEKYAETIRASFNRSIYGEEIRQAQDAQKDTVKTAREELCALLTETNAGGVFPVERMVQRKEFAAVLEKMDALVRAAPRYGSLKYQYLPEDYRTKVKELLEDVKQLPFFAARYQDYLDSVRHVSILYGNGKKTGAKQLAAAQEKFDRALGNEVMNAVRTVLHELEQDAPQCSEALQSFAAGTVASALEGNEAYAALLQALPRERIPISVLREIPKYAAFRDMLINDLFSDASLRAQIKGYAKNQTVDTEESDDGEKHTNTSEKAAEREAYADFCCAVERNLNERIYEDMGYRTECVQTNTLFALLRSFSLLTQLRGQSRAQGASLRLSHDLSREAKKDLRQRKSQESEMDFE